MTYIVTPAEVREYLALNATPSSSKYTDGTIGSNILAAQEWLESKTNRYFVDRDFSTTPWVTTSMLRAIINVPAFRTFTSVSWGGSILTISTLGQNDGSVWPLPDAQQTGVYTGLQFRALRGDLSGGPWWQADRQWWDKALDSPFYPGNYGGGFIYTSMPNDLAIFGHAGYADGTWPFVVRQAVKVLAAFYTLRPTSILADVTITPQGGVITNASIPGEVLDFVSAWRVGEGMVSVG